MSFNKLKDTTMDELQFGAGVIVDTFNVETRTIGNILWATSGGSEFADKPEYTDFGEDIDNCPANMKELKRITSREITLSGTALTVTASLVKDFIGAADVAGTKITPRDSLSEGDFADRWLIADWGDDGCIAIHLMNTLNTDGFQLQTTEEEKGTFAYTLTAHYSIDAQDTVPYEIYVLPKAEG